MSGDEFEAEGGGGVVQAGAPLALHFFLLLLEHFRVERFPMLEPVPQEARQVDSFAPAHAALRAFASDEFLSRLSPAASVCVIAVIALGVPPRAFQPRWRLPK